MSEPTGHSSGAAGGCPLGHDKRGAAAGAGAAAAASAPATCPVDHGKAAQRRDEPMPGAAEGGAVGGGCPLAKVRQHNNLDRRDGPADPLDRVSGTAIPAAGRGNSDSGREWLNPSPKQLYRALHRKNKGIDIEDAASVSMVHNAVTEMSWTAVMEYERMHARRCAAPTLSRFQGMDGIFSAKARFVHWMGWANLPFDRHDWYVDRCGKEVRYIIDYYSAAEKDGDVSYYIDARPAPTLGGLADRARLAFTKWRAGESFW